MDGESFVLSEIVILIEWTHFLFAIFIILCRYLFFPHFSFLQITKQNIYSKGQWFWADLHFMRWRYFGYFNPLKLQSKVMSNPWLFSSKHIRNGTLKWGNKQWFWSHDCKNIAGQSWRLPGKAGRFFFFWLPT